ncbi:hypothetical protein L0244_40510 [bacterium]|nr:hypothetical protein [bacterium]
MESKIFRNFALVTLLFLSALILSEKFHSHSDKARAHPDCYYCKTSQIQLIPAVEVSILQSIKVVGAVQQELEISYFIDFSKPFIDRAPPSL